MDLLETTHYVFVVALFTIAILSSPSHLTGAPIIANTNGDITISGGLTIPENLAIVAASDVSSESTSSSIVTSTNDHVDSEKKIVAEIKIIADSTQLTPIIPVNPSPVSSIAQLDKTSLSTSSSSEIQKNNIQTITTPIRSTLPIVTAKNLITPTEPSVSTPVLCEPVVTPTQKTVSNNAQNSKSPVIAVIGKKQTTISSTKSTKNNVVLTRTNPLTIATPIGNDDPLSIDSLSIINPINSNPVFSQQTITMPPTRITTGIRIGTTKPCPKRYRVNCEATLACMLYYTSVNNNNPEAVTWAQEHIDRGKIQVENLVKDLEKGKNEKEKGKWKDENTYVYSY